MRMLMTALALGALITGPAFVQSADAQRSSDQLDARTRAIQECNALNKKDPHEPFSGSGGVGYHYKACMAERGHHE
jgi:hypothetical protein